MDLLQFIIDICIMLISLAIELCKLVMRIIYSIIFSISKSSKAKERLRKIENNQKECLGFVDNHNLVEKNSQFSGVVFGLDNYNQSKYVIKPATEQGHILITGGTGSGKTSCIAIPTLKHFSGNVFCIDIKGELYNNTSDERNNIKILNPLKDDTYGYNPYYMLDTSDNLTQDIRDIVLSIIPLSESVKEPFWTESAQNLLSSVIVYCYKNNKSFIETIEFILSKPIKEILNIIRNSDITEAKLFINGFLNIDDKTISSIYTELSNKIMIFFTDNNLRGCLSKENFIKPIDLEVSDIYLQIPENKIDQWKNFINLIITQFLKYFEKRKEENNKEILFLLDEFARLGRINNILSALSTLRSRHVTVCLIIQSLAQLDYIYKKEARQIICDNCNYKAVLNVADVDSQEYFSKLAGTHDRIKINLHSNLDEEQSITETTEERRMIKPEELANMGNKLLLIHPHGHFIVIKAPYYNEIKTNEIETTELIETKEAKKSLFSFFKN